MTFGKLLERLLHLVPVLLGVSVIVFLMITLTPGDPVNLEVDVLAKYVEKLIGPNTI